MENLKSKALKGKNNKRINKRYKLESEETAAWTDSVSKSPETNVSNPSINAVENAKEWVDNGSRL